MAERQATTSNNKQQQATTSNNKQQQATTSNNKHQQATTSNNKQQQATTSNNKQQQATTSNNKQQQATTSNNKQTRRTNCLAASMDMALRSSSDAFINSSSLRLNKSGESNCAMPLVEVEVAGLELAMVVLISDIRSTTRILN
jgi:hypothetical protein